MRIAGHTMGTPELSVPEAIDLFAGLGLEGIEAICHDEYRRDLLLRAIEVAQALGAGCIRTYPGRETGEPGRAERFRRLVDALHGPAEAAAKAGVRLGLENHCMTGGCPSSTSGAGIRKPFRRPRSG
jgi:sugar phosphate isomerase/epimerase